MLPWEYVAAHWLSVTNGRASEICRYCGYWPKRHPESAIALKGPAGEHHPLKEDAAMIAVLGRSSLSVGGSSQRARPITWQTTPPASGRRGWFTMAVIRLSVIGLNSRAIGLSQVSEAKSVNAPQKILTG